MAAYIEVTGVCKCFRGSGRQAKTTEVLRDFSLSVSKGEFVTFFGPNACGKSTLLSIVAGLVPQDSGTVCIGGLEPRTARIGFVFQHNQTSLLPWRTNLDNVALPLELAHVSRTDRRKKASEFLQQLDVQIPADGYPYQLSGGQQQLLCIARALIADPDVLLMDEPFNQLDFQTRVAMNEKLQDIWMRTGKTTLFVSHDLDEALLLADRAVILSKRPAAIAATIENRLPRPRSRALLLDEGFFRLKKKALGVFEEVIAA